MTCVLLYRLSACSDERKYKTRSWKCTKTLDCMRRYFLSNGRPFRLDSHTYLLRLEKFSFPGKPNQDACAPRHLSQWAVVTVSASPRFIWHPFGNLGPLKWGTDHKCGQAFLLREYVFRKTRLVPCRPLASTFVHEQSWLREGKD